MTEVKGQSWLDFCKQLGKAQQEGCVVVRDSGVKIGMSVFVCRVEEGDNPVEPVGEKQRKNFNGFGSVFKDVVNQIADLQEQGYIVVGGDRFTTFSSFVDFQDTGEPIEVESEPKDEQEASSEALTDDSEVTEGGSTGSGDESPLESLQSDSKEVDEESVPEVEYTEETLKELDFTELKEIGNEKFGVTGRSKKGIIEDILKAQAEQE